MKFRSYDSLKTFHAVARSQSMTVAAHDLNLSKGSISYQIKTLEIDLGFSLFERNNARLQLTERGRRIWNVSQNALGQIDQEIYNFMNKERLEEEQFKCEACKSNKQIEK